MRVVALDFSDEWVLGGPPSLSLDIPLILVGLSLPFITMADMVNHQGRIPTTSLVVLDPSLSPQFTGLSGSTIGITK